MNISHDTYYGQRWEKVGNISYQELGEVEKVVEEISYDVNELMRTRLASRAGKESDIKKMTPTQKKEAKLKWQEFKWKGNNLAVTSSPVMALPPLCFKDKFEKMSHLPKPPNIWARTPRKTKAEEREELAKTLIREENIGLREPNEFSTKDASVGEAVVYHSITRSRKIISQKLNYIRRPYGKLERKFFSSPYGKPYFKEWTSNAADIISDDRDSL